MHHLASFALHIGFRAALSLQSYHKRAHRCYADVATQRLGARVKPVAWSVDLEECAKEVTSELRNVTTAFL